MSKAEERALEAYPIDSYEGHDDMYRQRGAFAKGYEQAIKDLEKEIEHRTLNAHDLPDDAKNKEFYCGMDEAFTGIMVYLDSLNN